MFNISGKSAIVTGASRGLGAALAMGFAKSGVNLALISRSVPTDLIQELQEFDIEVRTYSFDFSQPSQIPELIEEIYHDFGSIDILVNNAGAQRRSDSVDFSEEDWDYVINVNQKSVFLMCREVGRRMVEARQGKIINMASLLSFQGGYRVPAYAASKGAVMQFTKSLANEWAKFGVNVNCIAPGYMLTEMNTALVDDPVRSEQILVRIPAGRWGNPEDLVGAALFLSSSASDYVNGITLPVDGGWLGR
jgi:Dehydrogenases with different specificities (related to short-chain alcohol dehydrogenases)